MRKATMIIKAGDEQKALAFITKRLEVCTKPQTLILMDATAIRSKDQHSLLWLWQTEISNELGWEKEQVHLFHKKKFLIDMYIRDGIKVKSGGFEEDAIVIKKALVQMKEQNASQVVIDSAVNNMFSTTKLSIKQMREYLTNIKMDAAGWGFAVSEPSLRGLV